MEPDARRDEEATYERWKYAGSSVPFRYSFSGLAFIAALLGLTADSWWNSRYWYLGVLSCGLLFVGGITLFYDVPRRRLSLVARAFLAVGFVAVAVLTVLKANR
jgi:hypothetical protein